METAHNSRIFTIFEGASEIQRVITGSDVRYPADPGYGYYRGTSSKTGRLTGKRGCCVGSSGACGSRLCGPPSPRPTTRETTITSGNHEMTGQSQKSGRTVGGTAPTPPVRGFFPPRPWAKPSAHGRMADGGGPGNRLERCMRWSAAWASGRSDGL